MSLAGEVIDAPSSVTLAPAGRPVSTRATLLLGVVSAVLGASLSRSSSAFARSSISGIDVFIRW